MCIIAFNLVSVEDYFKYKISFSKFWEAQPQAHQFTFDNNLTKFVGGKKSQW